MGKSKGPKQIQKPRTRERVMVLQASGKIKFIWRDLV